MGYVDLLDDLPKLKRPVEDRAQVSQKDIELSWKLDREYFDGTRVQGYGGYHYDGRWMLVAKRLISYYDLKDNDWVLDIGCAKGYLLVELLKLMPRLKIVGLDISKYALENAHLSVKGHIVLGNAKELPFSDRSFKLVFSKDSLHNILNRDEVVESLREIERVSSEHKYIRLGAYENDEEKDTLDKWAVVATTYMHTNEWLKLFKEAGYSGDYSWFKP